MNVSKSLRNLVTAALFAAAITVVTAYFLHIPIPGTSGYVHLGDALIYLAACLLPMPYAVGAASIGASLADLLTAPAWVAPTFFIKAMIVLQFSSESEKLLSRRNIVAACAATILSPTLYTCALFLMAGGEAGLVPQFIGTLIQGVGSLVVFFPIAIALDRMDFKAKLHR